MSSLKTKKTIPTNAIGSLAKWNSRAALPQRFVPFFEKHHGTKQGVAKKDKDKKLKHVKSEGVPLINIVCEYDEAVVFWIVS